MPPHPPGPLAPPGVATADPGGAGGQVGRTGGLAFLRGSVWGERTWAACAININTVSPHQCVTGALVCLKVAFRVQCGHSDLCLDVFLYLKLLFIFTFLFVCLFIWARAKN